MEVETDDIPSLRKDVRKRELVKGLDEMPLKDLERLLAKQSEILGSKVVKSLPDKGEKLKKSVEDIKDRIAKIQQVLQEQTATKSTKEPPTIHLADSSSTQTPSTTPIDPLEEFYGKETYEEIMRSMKTSSKSEDSEVEWLQRKMQFLSVKGLRVIAIYSSENRTNQSSNKQRDNVLIKGNRALQKYSKPHTLVALSLKESLKLTETIKFEKEEPLSNVYTERSKGEEGSDDEEQEFYEETEDS